MRCPKCGFDNDNNRTICSKCSYYMYRADINNRARMTKAQRRKEDMREAKKNISKVTSVVWIVLVMIVMSFWIIALMVWLTGVDF